MKGVTKSLRERWKQLSKLPRQKRKELGPECKGTPPFPPQNGMTTLWSYLSLFTGDT